MRSPRLLPTRLAAAVTLVLVLAACEAEKIDTNPVVGTEVTVVDNAFEPPVLQIEAGQEVTWTWEGDNPHDVTFADGGSPVQRSGTYSRSFQHIGEFDYTCTVHGRMSGRIVVVEP